jgi:hypothetical protein
VLAKHDEKYMPPEVEKSLKRRHGEAREEALNETAAPGAAGGQASQAGAAQAPTAQATSAGSPAGT